MYIHTHIHSYIHTYIHAYILRPYAQEDASKFVLVEVYKDDAAPAKHKETAHYAAWRDAGTYTLPPPFLHPTFPLPTPYFYPSTTQLSAYLHSTFTVPTPYIRLRTAVLNLHIPFESLYYTKLNQIILH